MIDPALAFHRVSARCYDLTNVRTGSVRDQLLRSTLVVRGLLKAKLISADLPLLVLGAGPAGINAAILAAHRGVSVTVLEKTARPFATLHRAGTRRIDPTEYDWPQPHWRHGRFPIAAVGTVPLMQHSGTGAELAATWEAEWRFWLSQFDGVDGRGVVTLLSSRNARDFVAGRKEINGTLQVAGPWSGTVRHRTFGAALSCVGFGEETTGDSRHPPNWDGYRGPAFWHDDDGLYPGAALPPAISRVLISGGGDGALQDVQRVLSYGYFGRQLFELIDAEARAIDPAFDIAPPGLREQLLAAEDVGRRAYAWHGSPPPEQALSDWHAAFESAVRDLAGGWPVAYKLALAKRILRPELYQHRLYLTWLTREPQPGYAYALNRYLVLLLCELADADPLSSHRFRRLHQWEVDEIRAATPAHACGTAARCMGKPHQVVIRQVGTGRAIAEQVDLVIIRHGTKPEPLLGGPMVREQMVPYDVPR